MQKTLGVQKTSIKGDDNTKLTYITKIVQLVEETAEKSNELYDFITHITSSKTWHELRFRIIGKKNQNSYKLPPIKSFDTNKGRQSLMNN